MEAHSNKAEFFFDSGLKLLLIIFNPARYWLKPRIKVPWQPFSNSDSYSSVNRKFGRLSLTTDAIKSFSLNENLREQKDISSPDKLNLFTCLIPSGFEFIAKLSFQDFKCWNKFVVSTTCVFDRKLRQNSNNFSQFTLTLAVEIKFFKLSALQYQKDAGKTYHTKS